MRARGVGKGDLKSEGDEAVGEGHEEIGHHCSDPAGENKLIEFDGWAVGGRGDEFGVDGEEEGEGEEGDDYEVDKTDRDCGGNDGWVEGPERELRKTYCWVQGLGCGL